MRVRDRFEYFQTIPASVPVLDAIREARQKYPPRFAPLLVTVGSRYGDTIRWAYWRYVRVTLAAQEEPNYAKKKYRKPLPVRPMTTLQWGLLTDESVRKSIKFWQARECGRFNVFVEDEDEHNRPWAKKARTHRPDDVMIGHIAELITTGELTTMGELRRDGLVHPVSEGVRSQTTSTGGEDIFPHRLLHRICQSCKTYLPACRFGKNGKPSGRAICVACDSKKRVERRRSAAGRRLQDSPITVTQAQLASAATAG